jgi:hypothetical protein
MKLPMYITLTCPNENKFLTKNFIFENLDECLNKIIITVKDHINKKNDFPNDLDEFTNIHWYENNIMNNEVFDYYIFINDEWKQPWTLQEIYDDVIEIIHKNDIQKAILDPKNQADYESDEEDSILESHNNTPQKNDNTPQSNDNTQQNNDNTQNNMDNILEEITVSDDFNKLQKMLDDYLETQH